MLTPCDSSRPQLTVERGIRAFLGPHWLKFRYTVYTGMGERAPSNIRSQLTNARQRARYFSGIQDGKMILSHAGENFGRHDSVTTDDDQA